MTSLAEPNSTNLPAIVSYGLGFGTWGTSPLLPTDSYDQYTVVSVPGSPKVFVIGGRSNSTDAALPGTQWFCPSASVLTIDFASAIRGVLQPMPYARSNHFTALDSKAKRIYAGMGNGQCAAGRILQASFAAGTSASRSW
eukprot:tig00021179_g19235.t1